MRQRFRGVFRWAFHHHIPGAFAMMLVVTLVIGGQVENRWDFATGTLHADVEDRWGAPIAQPVPSLRFVESGTVFNTLQPLPFNQQRVVVDADMNYRKRGLVYFSGFDFTFRGTYVATNPLPRDIDAAFVFPIDMQKNRVLLSELTFLANGAPASPSLGAAGDRLTWTGRVAAGGKVSFEIAFRGRGLDSFSYLMDPALPVRDLVVTVNVRGGENFDYPDGVAPATVARTDGDRAVLEWRYASLESGIPVGLILPSEKAYDHVIATMIRRSWATFLLFFAGLAALVVVRRERPAARHVYLVAAGYSFFYVLLPYLAAYMNFYVAWAVTLLVLGGMITAYVRGWLGPAVVPWLVLLYGACLVLPTAAVFFVNHTGLIYTLEILVALGVLMLMTTRKELRPLVERVLASMAGQTDDAEVSHAP